MSFLTSEQTDKLYPALISAQAQMPPLSKESKAHHGKYASIEEIIRSAYPWLAKHKLCVKTAATFENEQSFVTCRIIHESNQFIEGKIPVLVVPLEKENIQALGARISYLTRYMLRDMLGFHNAELDDDGTYEVDVKTLPKKEITYYINQEQIDQLEAMMLDHPDIKQKLLGHYKITQLAFIQANKFWECHDAIVKIKDRYKSAQNSK